MNEQFTARYGISELDLLQVVRIRLGLDFVKPTSGAAPSVERDAAPIKTILGSTILNKQILPVREAES